MILSFLFAGTWRVLVVCIFLASGLEILSTSYAGKPGKVALTGDFLGYVRNIRVKISNHFMILSKIGFGHPPEISLCSEKTVLICLSRITLSCYNESAIFNYLTKWQNNIFSIFVLFLLLIYQ